MSGGYYDMDAILSEEERVPCVFTLDATGMGMLDPTTSEEDLAQGTKVRRSGSCSVAGSGRGLYLPSVGLRHSAVLIVVASCQLGWVLRNF